MRNNVPFAVPNSSVEHGDMVTLALPIGEQNGAGGGSGDWAGKRNPVVKPTSSEVRSSGRRTEGLSTPNTRSCIRHAIAEHVARSREMQTGFMFMGAARMNPRLQW